MIQKLFRWQVAYLSMVILLSISELAAWSSPADLSGLSTNDLPISAVDASGNGIVVWLNGSSSSSKIKAATYISGVWSSPIDLTGTGSYGSPSVQVDSAGNAVAVWEHFNNGLHEIQAVSIPFNGSPGSVATLSFAGDNRTPSIILDNSGNGFAVWNDRTNDKIMAAKLVLYNVWVAPLTLATNGGLFIPGGSMSGSGHAITFWFNSGSDTAQSGTYVSSSWNADGAIDTTTSPVWDEITTAIDPSGNAIAVWVDDTNFRVIASHRNFGGSWGSSAIVSDDIFSTCHSVKMDSSGNAVAVWINNDQNIVEAASYVSGSWQSPVVISQGVGNQSAFVAVSSSGNATAIYQNLEGGIIDVVAHPFGGSWGSPVQISGNDGYSFNPYISGNSSGNSIAVWVNSDGTNSVIQASVN